MAKFKREVVRCAEEKGNYKATAIFGVDDSNVRLWWKHNAEISECESSQKKFTGFKKGQFPDAVFMFIHERCKTGIHCIVLFYGT
jgi:hypothetical protein